MPDNPNPGDPGVPGELSPPKNLVGSIYSEGVLPPKLCELINGLETHLGMPVWLFIQNWPRDESYYQINHTVYKGFQNEILRTTNGQAVALLIESPGGQPDDAYRIARLFQRRFPCFVVLVPQYAKSAATLLALGATDLILGRDAEIGPLDLQVFDSREERMDSALNAVQSLERLNAYALTAVDQAMLLLMRRLQKKSDILLPLALDYVAKLMRPLLEKVDTLDYTRKSRDLKVAEEYAARLMRKVYGFARGREIARKLVENYSTHGFVIDREEALSDYSEDEPDNVFGLGLKGRIAAPELQKIFDDMIPFLDDISVFGRLKGENDG